MVYQMGQEKKIFFLMVLDCNQLKGKAKEDIHQVLHQMKVWNMGRQQRKWYLLGYKLVPLAMMYGLPKPSISTMVCSIIICRLYSYLDRLL